MTVKKWTDEQLAAIESQGMNILVSAGAGSGKTAVLVERIIHRLTDSEHPLAMDRILIVTFTNAAAEEMRQRISAALTETAAKNPHNKYFLRQLSLLPQASIMTLHSFCLNIVRNYFYYLDLDADLRIAGQLEQVLLKEEVLEQYIEEEYDQENLLLFALADAYGGNKDDHGLWQLILDLYEYSRGQPHPRQWLEQIGGFFREKDLNAYPWSQFLAQDIQRELDSARQELSLAKKIAFSALLPDSWYQQLGAEEQLLASLQNPNYNLQELLAAIKEIAFLKLPAAKNGDKDDKKALTRQRDKAKRMFNDLKSYFCAKEASQWADDLAGLGDLMEIFCHLVIGYEDALQKEKNHRGILDFADMEHYCLQLLEDPKLNLREEIGAGFDEILVDEYQDINGVQERILNLISSGENFFAVGDVKQSIYGFRLADPGLFLAKYHDYAADQGGKRIDLNKNFRSCGEIIGAVNFVFKQLMSLASSGLDYDDKAALKAGKEDLGRSSELSLLDMSRDDDFEDADWSGSWQEECRLLGCRIQKMRDEGYDYRDMAILLRSPRAKEAVLLEELQKMAIPAIAGQGGNSLESPEASLMVALLQIIDNPLQDIPMAAVLHSPIFDFSLDEMVKLRFDYPQKYLYRSLEAASKQSAESADIDNSHNKSDNKANSEDLFLLKVADFWQKLCRWRLESKKMKVSSFIWQLYQETGIYHLAGAMMKGEERQANLFSLYQRAIEYENSSFKGIFRFLRFLEDINAGGGKISPPRLLAENENVVRIMSIHRSKGLEFPVVFIAGLGGLFNFRDLQGDLIFDKDFGLGPKIVDLQKRIKFPSLAHEAIARKLRKQSIAEEIRILYVAMTRAKEKLILTASLKNLQKSAEKWALPFLAEDGDQEKISVNYLYKDRRPIDWLARTLLRHPDGKKLRLLAGLDESICLDDPSHWLIDICHPVSLVHKENPRQHQYLERVKDGFLLEETAYKKQMEEILSYQYPASKYCDFTAKWTVSQLQKTFAPPVFEESQELFPEEAEENTFSFQDKEKKQKSSSERGSVWHLFLQLLDLQRINSLEELRLQLVDLQAAGVMASFADEDLLRSVWRFWTSDLGQRAKKAAIIERERTFTYRLPGKFLIEEAQEDDFLIVQGMVDLAFYEDGAWVLLDYKTGGLSLSEAQILESYQNQLLLYKKALEDIWLAPVQEAYLYMLDDGRIIKMGQ